MSDVPVKLQQLKERYGPAAERVSHLDGISFEFADWHFNVRPSNTEPLLRLNLEALDADTMERAPRRGARADPGRLTAMATDRPPAVPLRPPHPGRASTRPTRRASSTTAATCPTSTAPGSSTCAALGMLGHVPGEPEFAMRAQHVEYHAPARFDDEVEVFVRAERLGRTSVTWAFDAYRVDTGEHLASATQVVVAIDPDERRRRAGSRPRIRAAVARFEQHEVEA